MKKDHKPSKSLKKTARKLHLYIGLITGFIVFILSITGCCWVFQQEIRGLADDFKTVEVKNTPYITATKAKAIAQKVFPKKSIHGVSFGQPSEAVEVIFYEAKPKFYQKVYINPYSGKVIKAEDQLSGFFAFPVPSFCVCS